MKIKNLIPIVLVLGAAVTGITWYALQSKATGSSSNPPNENKALALGGGSPVTISAVPARKQNVPVTVDANGSVVSLNSVVLHPQTTSTIRQVHIKEGQFVHAGDLLFTLDDRADRANLDRAQAELARDQASLADYERQFKRSTDLVAQNFLSQSALDAVRSQLESQRAAVRASRAAIQSSQVASSYNLIRAPSSGLAGAITVFPGSLVQPSTALVTITQLNPIAVSFTLPERSLQSLLRAKKAGDVAVSVIVPEAMTPLRGILSFIDNTVDPQAGTIRVKANFENIAGSLWPGQYVNVRIVVDTLTDAVVIPQAAIITNTLGKQVYIVDAEQKAKPMTVSVLTSFGEQAAVSGLQGGERVIVEGKQNLRPGSLVREAAVAERKKVVKGTAQDQAQAGSKTTRAVAGQAQ